MTWIIRMLVLALAVGSGLANPVVAEAGCLWQGLSPGAIEGDWTAVVGVSPTDTWMFGTSAGGLAHWDGSRWTSESAPVSPSAADATAADDVWEIGRTFGTATVSSRHYDGATWTDEPMVNPPDGTTRLGAASAVSKTLAYAGGSLTRSHRQVAILERWTGSGWVLARRPAAAEVSQLAAISHHDIWALVRGPADGLSPTALAHWDGNVWTTVRPQPPGVTLTDVSARAADDVWAVGYSATDPATYHYDGSSWSPVPVPPVVHPGHLQAVSALKGTATVAVGGGDGAPSSHDMLLRFARGSWHVEHSNILPGSGFLLVSGVPGSTEAWAVGTGVVVHRGC